METFNFVLYCVCPPPLSLGADEVSGGEFVMAAAHHGYFYDKGDSL
jgi:hypothetical protein